MCVCCREIKCQHWSWAVHAVPLLCLLPTSPPPTTVAPFLTRSLTSLPRQTGNTVLLCSKPFLHVDNHLCSWFLIALLWWGGFNPECGLRNVIVLMQFWILADLLTALFVSVQRRGSEAGQREDPQSAPDDRALRLWHPLPPPPPFQRMNHPTSVHLHSTFSSYKYIIAYRLYLLFICFTVDDFIFINLTNLSIIKPKWTHTRQTLQLWPVLPAWSVCHLIKC